MSHAKLPSVMRWIALMMAFVLSVDVTLSIYKVYVFRDAIPDTADFLAVVMVYIGIAAVPVMTALSASGELWKRGRLANACLATSSALATLLLALNFFDLPQWPSTALENKISTLLVCMALSVTLLLVRLRSADRT